MYWNEKGGDLTEKTLDLARAQAQKSGAPMVIASNTGRTIRPLLGSGVPLICVTHHVGFNAPGEDEMPPEVREELQKAGVKILTTTHLFAGVDRGLRLHSGGLYPPEIMAHTLRMFGQGTKVAVEIAVMALDAGLIPYGTPVVSVGGTRWGADTALWVRPAHAHAIFETRILEVICRPREG